MGLSLDSLDMPVLVPAELPLDALQVVATDRERCGAALEQEFWYEVTVAPREGAEGAMDWQVATTARRGVRPSGPGDGLRLDGDLRGAAEGALGGLLLQQVPGGLSREEAHRRVEDCTTTARATAGRLSDAQTWTRTTLDVDGSTFALWVHQRDGGLAAAADLGVCLVSMHGRTPPRAWRFSLLAPAQARRLPVAGG